MEGAGPRVDSAALGGVRAPTADVRVFETPGELAEAAADLFVTQSKRAIAAQGRCFVALTGGTTPAPLHRLLGVSPRREHVDWTRVEVFFGDERGVPEGHADRNDLQAMEALLRLVAIPRCNVHSIDADAPDGAERHEKELRETFTRHGRAGVPAFDLIYLGMGPDGHVASLFPGHASLSERDRLVIGIVGSPKPPPVRVTFTLPLLNAARLVVFLVTGSEKGPAVARALAGDPALPAAHVRPAGKLLWLLDRAAADAAGVSR